MTRSRYTERDNITDRFVKTWIRAFLENCRLIFILQIILYVTHFMMCCQKILHVNARALLNSEIFAIVEVPSACVTNHIYTFLFRQNRSLPECVRHGSQVNRRKEVLSEAEHTCCIISCIKNYEIL
ncbi:hypothetical protein PUN28_004578 [Cardiocondyla obscurior]|uniref:Uncharacterized protein n=1 Tax=Cardiocondyla obscurior TaxID=286306 RepID=A0AAW2GBG0_9HYME